MNKAAVCVTLQEELERRGYKVSPLYFEGGCLLDFRIPSVRAAVSEQIGKQEYADIDIEEIWASVSTTGSIRVNEGEIIGEIPIVGIPIPAWNSCEVNFDDYDKLKFTASHFHQTNSVSSSHIHFEGEGERSVEDIVRLIDHVRRCEARLVERYKEL